MGWGTRMGTGALAGGVAKEANDDWRATPPVAVEAMAAAPASVVEVLPLFGKGAERSTEEAESGSRGMLGGATGPRCRRSCS